MVPSGVILVDMTTPTESDVEAALVQRFKAGDQDAFHTLHELHGNGLRYFLKSKCIPDAEVDDIAQEVWLRSWKHRDAFDGQHFRGWIFTIAKRYWIDEIRRKSTRHKHQEQLEYQARDNELTDDGPSELLDALRECVEATGGDFVEVLRAEISGEAVESIAKRLDIAPNTVYSRKNRGKQQLKDCIERKLR